GKGRRRLKGGVGEGKMREWVGGRNEGRILEWGKGSTGWLVSEEKGSGGVKMEKEMRGKKVWVGWGKMWVGREEHVEGKEVEKVWGGGEEVDRSIVWG
uniref:hypothetical protein n=1 Tax=Kocuria salsicia TaxID=664639 RepID=UPI0016437A93